MLIGDTIKHLCDQGRLFEVRPLDWRAPIERKVYVSPDLHRFLTQPSSDKGANLDRRKLQRLFDRFISGRGISVALERRTKSSDLKRLSRGEDEVWEFKVRAAKPQLRVFGRFASVDIFIALTGPVDRRNCDYPGEIIRCQREWHTLLPEYSPVHGSQANDYISTNVVSLGNS